jgi:hypothetical protein
VPIQVDRVPYISGSVESLTVLSVDMRIGFASEGWVM